MLLCLAFMWVPGIRTQALTLVQQALCPQRCLPTPTPTDFPQWALYSSSDLAILFVGSATLPSLVFLTCSSRSTMNQHLLTELTDLSEEKQPQLPRSRSPYLVAQSFKCLEVGTA